MQLSNNEDEVLLLINTEKLELIFLTKVLSKSYTIFERLHIPSFILFDNCDAGHLSNSSYRGIFI